MPAPEPSPEFHTAIDGLQWVERWRIDNGRSGSFVIPFPTTRPVNIVVHGDAHFEYGQYGVHLGQQDVLTFLGDSRQVAQARFIDCRRDSPTFRQAVEFSFSPSSSRSLIIPPGVAHTFSHLEGIFTLNAYVLFLPPIEELLLPQLRWAPERDIINLPLDTDPATVMGYVPMSEPAAHCVYYQIAERQRELLATRKIAHGETRTFTLDDGQRIELHLQAAEVAAQPPALPVSAITGVAFKARGAIVTGPHSCIIPVAGPSPLYIVEHGREPYEFESFGVHLGQEDHLTFLGPAQAQIKLKLVDMRAGSNTLHVEEWHTFACDPNLELVLPCGVAHALFNMADVFTLNRPALYIDEEQRYRPGHDVIDWPLNDLNYPVFETLSIPTAAPYLEHVAAQQALAMTAPARRSTPQARVLKDPDTGKWVKVVLHRSEQPGAQP